MRDGQEDHMLRRFAFALFVVALTSAVLSARAHATLILKSGERVTGDLIDMGGHDFTIQVDKQQRHVRRGDVAVVEFASGGPTPSPSGSEHVLVLRSGEALHGHLTDIGGTQPLKIRFRADGKDRQFTSNDVSRIVLGAHK
jgi:hypothetical protein